MFIERLIEFYHRSKPEDARISSIWSGIVGSYQSELVQALNERNAAKVQAIFDDPKKTTETIYGLDTVVVQEWGRDITTAYFPFLAWRVGALPARHPIQPSPDENWNFHDGIELKKKIENVIGPIQVPNGFLRANNETGIPYSYFSKLAEWHTISSLMNPPPKCILEIGAGTGGLALAAFNNGVRDYTIIDIPSTAVISAYYVSKACGDDSIWMDGEAPNPTAFCRWFACNNYVGAESKYDLIANVNSFPEMTIENQDDYIKFISRCLSVNGMFYSCNHESNMNGQSSVRSAVNRIGGFKTVYRAPFMMRDGYVEEFYRKA